VGVAASAVEKTADGIQVVAMDDRLKMTTDDQLKITKDDRLKVATDASTVATVLTDHNDNIPLDHLEVQNRSASCHNRYHR